MAFLHKNLLSEQHLQRLESHLQRENPVMLQIMKGFRDLDKVARQLKFFDAEESYARHVPWWPIVSVLGTYSAGKSTFLNDFLSYKLQSTGNQAVDDKFTVISYSKEEGVHVLPGLSLDADPRFPFFKISHEIEEVATGEGGRIDSYLQLKTCPSERLRGCIFIDSPGFDADEQRTAVLRITNYIIDLSDLVLVFFDARHPETGTMRDTLQHLVSETISRPDANKFLYILNQVDTAAREDNAEDVVASWERALAQHGLTAGRFYRIFSGSAAVPIEDEHVRARYESKRDADLAEISTRVQRVGVERAYRTVGALEQAARNVQEQVVPTLRRLMHSWKTRVLWMDGLLFGGILILLLISAALDIWSPFATLAALTDYSWLLGAAVVGLVLVTGYIHFSMRKRAAAQVIAKFRRQTHNSEFLDNYVSAFSHNTRFYQSIFRQEPKGWNQHTHERINQILVDAGNYVQNLNDAFTNPSGGTAGAPEKETTEKNATMQEQA